MSWSFLNGVNIMEQMKQAFLTVYFIDGLMILFGGCIPAVIAGVSIGWGRCLAAISLIYLLTRALLTFHVVTVINYRLKLQNNLKNFK